MKTLRILSLGALLLAATAASAAGKDWLTNFDEASKIAKESGKYVLVEFHGSDWCPPCIKLNNEVLSKDDFKAFANDKLVLVNADFPRKSALPADQRAHNEQLAQRFGVQYFPTVVVVTPDGKVLDKAVGFPKGGTEGFISFIQNAIKSSEG